MRRIGLRQRVMELERALLLAAREAVWETLGSEKNVKEPFALELKCILEPGNPWKVSSAMELEEQIRDALRDTALKSDPFKQGHVYCYRCESSCCQHSMPPTFASVFGGYSPTGLPRWVDLHQLLLDVRHPRLEELFDGNGKEILAVYLDGPSLKRAQLEVFGRMSRVYDIFGQVVFGLLAMGEERVALTAQAVQVRSLNNLCRMELNLLGRIPGNDGVWEAIECLYHGRVRDLLLKARRKIQLLGKDPSQGSSPKGGKGSSGAGSERVLKGLARGLEKIGRQASRRTLHAEKRRGDLRPTYKALEDAAAASPERILWDARKKTIVVLGPRQRAHVFSPQGRHITSLVLNGEAVDSRIRRKRWIAPEEELLRSFKMAIGAGAQRQWGICPVKP